MKKPVVFFCLTGLCWAFALGFAFQFARSMTQTAQQGLAKIEAPGSTFLAIEEPGPVTLWHNFEDFHQGKTVRNDPDLPGGYGFELREMGAASPLPFSSAGMKTTISSPRTSKISLGFFEVPSAGDYELTVTAPTGSSRVVSLSRGTPMQGVAKGLKFLLGVMIPGLAGFVTLLLAIVFLMTKSQTNSHAPLPPHAP